jgi:DNA mismatch endonuclease Vsr
VRRQQFKRLERALAGKTVPTTTSIVSERMGRVRQYGTMPELVVRRLLSEAGLHYRTRNRDLPGAPDLANRRRRWAVFVHGCFWHRHPHCPKASFPKSNADFWSAKFRRNVQRDARTIAALKQLGFSTAVFWECELSALTVRDDRILRIARL